MRHWDPKLYEQLLGLQVVDMDIRALYEEIDELVRKSKEEDPKLVQLRLDIENIDERIDGARAQHLMYRGTLEDIRSAISGLSTTKSGNVKPRTRSSTEALRIEEEKLGTLVYETERQIKQLERDREDIVREMEGRASEVDSSQQEPEAEIRKLQNRIKKLEAQREKDTEGLPAILLRRYDRLRGSRSGVGLTTLDNGICSVCRMEMPTSIGARLLQGEWIESCPACGRMVAKVTFDPQPEANTGARTSAARKKAATAAVKKAKAKRDAKKAAAAKKPTEKKAADKDASEMKVAAKKTAAKKPAAKKTAAKKPAAKKTTAKKAAAKKKTTVKKPAAKKTAAKKPAAKKTAAKKPAAKKTTAKKAVTKPPAKNGGEKKAAAKKATRQKSRASKKSASSTATKPALSENA